MSTCRRIIAHFHLFKNAGTSIDQLLQSNFGERWMTYDRTEGRKVICTSEFEQILKNNPEIDAFSSHQLIPPLPQGETKIFPIVFIRDPIDRVRSAYLFEWQKQLGLSTPKGSFAEYVESKLRAKRANAIEEFQTMRLSNTDESRYQNFDGLEDEEILNRAIEFIEQLPFIGIVDRFDESLQLLSRKLAHDWPEFKVHPVKANVLQSTELSLVSKKSRIQSELGAELYQRICDANRMDSKLYDYACNKFDRLDCEDESVSESLAS